MDVNLPKLDGITATREIKARNPEIIVVGLTFRIEDYIVYAMRKAGAFDVVAKDKLADDLYATIQRGVAAGGHPLVFPPEGTAHGDSFLRCVRSSTEDLIPDLNRSRAAFPSMEDKDPPCPSRPFLSSKTNPS
jgi:DNA-binding NarL/FixJ family response regulator